jgi:hypothetical protein
MSTNTFKRVEKKFYVPEETAERLMALFNEKMDFDPFSKAKGFYTICNIYYDTEHDDLIRKSLAKPVFKEKLRLRSYGVPGIEDKSYLELKKKYKGVVYKRRSSMKVGQGYAFVDEDIVPSGKGLNEQVLKEIEFFCKRYDLVPKVYLAYDRRAYSDGDLRITLDNNIRSRRHNLRLEAGDYGEPVLDGSGYIMEIKYSHSIPLWLAALLKEEKLYSSSFSKYGTEFVRYYNLNKSLAKGAA